MSIFDNLILRACAHLRVRTKKCGPMLAEAIGGDKHLAWETMAAVDALEQRPGLLRLASTWQMVRGLEGWTYHQIRIQKITGEKNTSKFL